MAKSKDAKSKALGEHGSLNPRPQDVKDELFQGSEFFDPHDIVQVKYEMLRRVRVDRVSVTRATQAFGFSELMRQNKTPTLRGHAIPHPGMFFREVTTYAVGCCVVEGSGVKKTLRNSVLIQANTPIPCQKNEHFVLEFDDQTEARIEILQGEADADRDDCLLIGELTLTNLPKEAKRTPRIQVEYTIDSNGMVTATATDKVSGQQQTVSVDYKKGVRPRQKPALV